MENTTVQIANTTTIEPMITSKDGRIMLGIMLFFFIISCTWCFVRQYHLIREEEKAEKAKEKERQALVQQAEGGTSSSEFPHV